MSIIPTADVARIFDQIEHRWDQENVRFLVKSYSGILRHVLRACDVRPQATVLDVGCGGGVLSMYFSSAGARVSAVDNHSELADANPWMTGEVVTRNLERAGVAFTRVDLAKDMLPFADGTFDLVLCQDVIEHLPSPRRCLSEIRRVLACGGCAFIGFPNGASFRNRVFGLLGRKPLYSAKEWYFEEGYRGHIYEPTWGDFPLIFGESRLRVRQVICHNDLWEPSGREDPAKRVCKRLLHWLTANRALTHGFIVKVERLDRPVTTP